MKKAGFASGRTALVVLSLTLAAAAPQVASGAERTVLGEYLNALW